MDRTAIEYICVVVEQNPNTHVADSGNTKIKREFHDQGIKEDIEEVAPDENKQDARETVPVFSRIEGENHDQTTKKKSREVSPIKVNYRANLDNDVEINYARIVQQLYIGEFYRFTWNPSFVFGTTLLHVCFLALTFEPPFSS